MSFFVLRVGEGGSAEVEPWWQLRFMNDHQPLRTVRLWSRVHEENPYSVQVRHSPLHFEPRFQWGIRHEGRQLCC
jgi:hypothetical protein